jgi:hypothetical protein
VISAEKLKLIHVGRRKLKLTEAESKAVKIWTTMDLKRSSIA